MGHRMMSGMREQAEALHRQAAEEARRASTAQDPVIESGYRRLARHHLRRAAELQRGDEPQEPQHRPR